MTAYVVVCMAVAALVPGAAAAPDINNVQIRYNRAALARMFAIEGAAADVVAVVATHGVTSAASVAEIVYAVAVAVLVRVGARRFKDQLLTLSCFLRLARARVPSARPSRRLDDIKTLDGAYRRP